MKYAAFAIVSILSAICVLGVGCSRDDSADPEVAKPSSPDETTEDTVTAPEPSLLDPSQWSMVKWNSREIHESVAESEASLETDAKGLLAKTHKKFQRVQVLLQMELFDDFEVHLHGCQGNIVVHTETSQKILYRCKPIPATPYQQPHHGLRCRRTPKDLRPRADLSIADITRTILSTNCVLP